MSTDESGVGDGTLLDEFRARYEREVAPAVEALLAARRRTFPAGLLVPVRTAHARRRNFFRSALLIESAGVAGRATAAPALAACAEVGWTCALVLDDIVDRSREREGGPSAHVEHGTLRSALAAACALLRIAWTLAARIPAPLRVRLGWVRLGVRLVLRAAVALLGPAPRCLSAYADAARRVNSSIEWSLLAPFCGLPRGPVSATLQRYARHSAVAGKMRNDLLDYWGGSSERDAVLDDFHGRRLTFPTLVLLAAPLSAGDRALVDGHFAKRRTIAADDLHRLFEKHSVREQCLAKLQAEIEASEPDRTALAATSGTASLARLLRRWDRHMLEGCRSRVLRHS